MNNGNGVPTILGAGIEVGTEMYETRLNNNVMVFGTSGSGKTTGLVLPNLLQCNSSYVVTDPKGNLHDRLAPVLEEQGYKVCRLDFANPARSCTWNPLQYVRNANDLESLAVMIADSDNQCVQDPFWSRAAQNLLEALLSLEMERSRDWHLPPSMHNVASLLDDWRLRPFGDHEALNRLDEIFNEWQEGVRWKRDGSYEECMPHYASDAYRRWQRFCGIAQVDTTSACIVMQLWSTLSRLTGPGVDRLLSNDDPVNFVQLGKRKTALFVVVSDMDRSMDFLVSIFYSQLFRELVHFADVACGANDNRLPVPVRVVMDDFANQTAIPDFDTIIAAVRSRDIWLMPICQSVAQLRQRYGASAETIVGNCDAQVFLGINDLGTARELSMRADIPVSEVQSMPVGTEMVFLRGHGMRQVPVYDVRKHPRYEQMEQARRRNTTKNRPMRRSA